MANPVLDALTALQAAIAAQPSTPVLPVSATGASIDSIGAYLFDANGNYLTLVAGNRGNDKPAQQIAYNGVTDATTGAVTTVVYSGGKFYQQNSAGNWWSGKPGAWVQVAADPRKAPTAPPAPSTPVSGPTPPPIAAAAGYTKLVFNYEPASSSDVQIGGSNRIGPGQTWVVPTQSPTGDLSQGGNINYANGILTLNGGILMQSVDFDGTGGFSLPRGGYYAQASIAFSPGASGDGAWWSEARQWLQDWSGVARGATQWAGAPSGFTVSTEKDFLENFFGANKPDTYQATLHEWYGIWPNNQNASNSTPAQDGTSGGTTFQNNVISTAGFDTTQFQVYGDLYIPSVNGSQGSDLFTFNDQATNDRVTWVGPHPNYTGVAPGAPPWTFSIQDEQDMFFFLGGPGANGGSTMVKWVRVWAKPTN